ncbi:hypothetical protein [Aureivirga sp. CE67]|uniref:hypothetical protein n=1 Tax=Aureivirga sp. CE67 TaxID=1788983 RepID=UPI0018CAE815|nr:hypothetical protein [Aureivirga sp. CE67]
MQDKKLLEGVISDYYNSVEDSFNYRLKNTWKIQISTFFFILSTGFLIFNILPFLPASIDNYLLWLFLKIKNNVIFENEEYSFWIQWALGSILSILIFVITFTIFRYWNIKEHKKAIKISHLQFCYAYILRKEIKSFLINENVSHLENISKYFNIVNSDLVLTPFYSNNKDQTTKIAIYELRNLLLKKYNWIEFSKETNELIDAFESINLKIKNRITQKAELEKVVPFVDILTLYEFSFIKPNLKNFQEIELKEQRFTYLKEIVKELNLLSNYEDLNEIERTKKSNIKSILNFFANLFTSSNILIMFISWLILLIIIFVATSILIIKKINIEVDSTILIGLLSAPFLGAITLSATIYSKNKNN